MSALREFWKIVRGIVDELTDRNAYVRHLAAHGVEHSGEEWRRFQDAHWAAKCRRGRCC
jgi:hypothetical protein